MNMIISILAILISILVWLYIPELININEGALVNSRFMAKFITVIFFFSSCMLLVDSIVHAKTREVQGQIEWKTEEKALGVFAIISIYIFSIGYLGFLISSLIMTIVFTFFLKTKRWFVYVINICLLFIIYFAFEYLLKIRLP